MKNNFRYLLLLIHYWFPVALGWSVVMVIHKATGMPIRPSGIELYLLSILAAYSLDRLIDNDDVHRPRWLTVALVLGLSISSVLGFILAINMSLQTLSALVVFALITVFYRRAKKFPIIKSLLVSVVWVWAGVAMAFPSERWLAWEFWTLPVSVPLVMLIACGCIMCDFKDIKSDGEHGVRSLPVLFGRAQSVLIISALLLVTAGISFLENRMGLVTTSAVLIALVQFPGVLAMDAVGPLIVDALLVLPGLLIISEWV